ncbi:MAG: hypothetical protein ABI770_08545 [Sphingomicrobium sp.]
MRIKPLLIASAAVLVSLPVLAQQAPQPAPVPAPDKAPVNTLAPATQQQTNATDTQGAPSDETAVEEVSSLNLPPPPPPIEYPGWARRDPWVVGSLDPERVGLGADPWGTASGAFLSTLMRRMHTPIASRWAHIALRDALLTKMRAPGQVNPVDWVAERAWLLLRLGEADAARMLVAGVDTDRFTPKMVQVAVQSALANADPPAMCPIEVGIGKYEPNIRALVQAMCSSLAGEPETAAAQIDDARRRGRFGGIDLNLADKVVGAGANTARAVSIEWNSVDTLTAWRFGLATATGMVPPDRLLNPASTQLRAFQARAPLLTPEQRLNSAQIAAGLGVFSSQSMVDLYSAIYDSTDPDDLSSTDAWQLRQAFVGKDADTRLAAIHRLLEAGNDPLQKEAMRALVARAATRVEPDPKVADAPELISAMLAAGYDQAAARWAGACGKIKDENGDRCWSMLVLGAPSANGLDLSAGRITSFIGRDKSRNKVRSALLVAGLAGLGRITPDAANSLNRRHGFGLGRQSSWTRMIDASAGRGQAGTVLVLTGTGFQTFALDRLPAVHVYHALLALQRTGQDFTARMIAAEALSRT